MSELRIWPVTARLNVKGIKIPQKIKSQIFKTFALEGMSNKEGVYDITEEGVWFLGLRSQKFRFCYGYLPFELEEPDPYQAVPAGTVLEWFEAFMKMEGFEKVKIEEKI